ncbi:hypothetical protein ACJMK2_041636 [Sinanodonta woodiana]|uniref:MYND-type domain-containing protein n=1 Tax=Sinanodonta woodiana TaxID=1069815 RepID=A0ABD3W4S5_SINWO
MASCRDVELGFVEEREELLLKSSFFPSKVGGKPAWLSLKPIPSPEQLSCKLCGETTIFLIQTYTPRDYTFSAYHRTLFIFVCRNPACCRKNENKNLRVLRSQLPKNNDFYGTVSTVEDIVNYDPTADKYQPVCIVCGAWGTKRCAKCHRVSYCSKGHQVIDWKIQHKKACALQQVATGESAPVADHGVLFPEYELVTEAEEYEEINEEKSEEEKMKGLSAFLKSDEAKDIDDLPLSELEKIAISEHDKVFLKFKERVAHEPDQVMPQLLIHLNVDSLGDSIDWGTLCVFTCADSCDIGNNYHEEFVYKQDVSDSIQ